MNTANSFSSASESGLRWQRSCSVVTTLATSFNDSTSRPWRRGPPSRYRWRQSNSHKTSQTPSYSMNNRETCYVSWSCVDLFDLLFYVEHYYSYFLWVSMYSTTRICFSYLQRQVYFRGQGGHFPPRKMLPLGIWFAPPYNKNINLLKMETCWSLYLADGAPLEKTGFIVFVFDSQSKDLSWSQRNTRLPWKSTFLPLCTINR